MTDAAPPPPPAQTLSPWEEAVLAATLFAVDPAGLGSIRVRARPGPAREEWLNIVSDILPRDTPVRRIPVNITAGRLLGGMDLAATLKLGRPVPVAGLLGECDGGVAILQMAERASQETAAILGQALDNGEVRVEREGVAETSPAAFGLIALDEGIEDEFPPASLLDRLAFHIDLDAVPLKDIFEDAPAPEDIARARRQLGAVVMDDDITAALAHASLVLGIESLRPVIHASRAAAALAALDDRGTVTRADAAMAARLVLAPRATILPDSPEETEAEPPPPPPPDETPDEEQEAPPVPESLEALQDMIVAAAAAAIPDALLARLRQQAAAGRQAGSTGRAGAEKTSATRGRPVGVYRDDVSRGGRINIIETLRAAAPWQRLRSGRVTGGRVNVRAEDFRFVRYKHRSETAAIFVVDASGSQALNRLAEVKGAVELLLAECYVRRDQVAMIVFRGEEAEMVLPPTRSLVRAKRRLAGLPGGGGTPLAAGIDASIALSDAVRRKGQTPAVVLMTDGRANIGRDGATGRDTAQADAIDAARALRAAGVQSILVDSSPRPQPAAKTLADEMGATYLPLPQARAEAVSKAVSAVMMQPTN